MSDDCYGFRSEPDDIEIEPKVGGNSQVLDEKYRRPHAAVRVVDTEAGNHYVWPVDTARDRAGRVRERAEPGDRCVGLAARLEEAADEAEAMYEEFLDGGD